MSKPITKSQNYFLKSFVHGWNISNPSMAHPSIRRLIKRGLIAPIYRANNKSYYKITNVGQNMLNNMRKPSGWTDAEWEDYQRRL